MEQGSEEEAGVDRKELGPKSDDDEGCGCEEWGEEAEEGGEDADEEEEEVVAEVAEGASRGEKEEEEVGLRSVSSSELAL